MHFEYHKYHALLNDFFIIELSGKRLDETKKSRLASAICERRSGMGADGVLYLSKSRKADLKADLYNADGTWAEKSGNGLRIIGLHNYLQNKKKKTIVDMAGILSQIEVIKKEKSGYLLKTDLGIPLFDTKDVPVKSKSKQMILAPLKSGKYLCRSPVCR